MRLVAALCLCIFSITAFSNPAPEVLLLQQSYRSMSDSLSHSKLLRPLQISSNESVDHLSGDLYGTVHYGLATLNTAVSESERWCEMMLLLSNSKSCRFNPGSKDGRLQVSMSGSKTADTAGGKTTEFTLQVTTSTVEYLDAALQAVEGPMGTHNISLRLQAIPLSETSTFFHLHYSYDTSWLGRIAMQAYLQTAGRGKVGFSMNSGVQVIGDVHIDGARGVIERNTMRYFLGMDCAMAYTTQKSPQRFNSMAACWYEQVEKYPLQLHEMQRNEYLQMKFDQYRQQLNLNQQKE